MIQSAKNRNYNIPKGVIDDLYCLINSARASNDERVLNSIKDSLYKLNQHLSIKFELNGNLVRLEKLSSKSNAPVHRYFHTNLRTSLAEKEIRKSEVEDIVSFNQRALEEIRNLLKTIDEENSAILQVYKIDYKPNEYCTMTYIKECLIRETTSCYILSDFGLAKSFDCRKCENFDDLVREANLYSNKNLKTGEKFTEIERTDFFDKFQSR